MVWTMEKEFMELFWTEHKDRIISDQIKSDHFRSDQIGSVTVTWVVLAKLGDHLEDTNPNAQPHKKLSNK